jgi:hypothetical protein
MKKNYTIQALINIFVCDESSKEMDNKGELIQQKIN